jgi:superfamily II DNA/RNA helicase
LIAISRAVKIRSKRLKAAKNPDRNPSSHGTDRSPAVLLLLPHAALVGQVGGWISRIESALSMDRLGGEGPLAEIVMPGDKQKTSRKARPEVLVSTPDALLSYMEASLPTDRTRQGRNIVTSAMRPSSLSRSLQLIMADEIDAMLRPLPGRFKTFTSERERQRHPFFRHPPAIVRLLDDMLRLGEMTADRPLQTVWSSATLNSVVRGFVQRSRWTRKEEQVVIDTTTTMDTTAQRPFHQLSEGGQAESLDGTIHHCLSIDPLTGNMRNLGAFVPDTISEFVEPDPNDPAFKERIHPLIIENLALLDATRSARDDEGYSLAIVPDGTSIPKLQDALSALGTSSMVMDGINEPEEGALLLVTRSHVRGLDIPNITTVYLLNGLDVTSMSKASRSAGGMEERKREYTHFAGRMKRLGATREGPVQYSMVNLVMQGSAEEGALHGMLADKPELEVRRFEGTGIDV